MMGRGVSVTARPASSESYGEEENILRRAGEAAEIAFWAEMTAILLLQVADGRPADDPDLEGLRDFADRLRRRVREVRANAHRQVAELPYRDLFPRQVLEKTVGLEEVGSIAERLSVLDHLDAADEAELRDIADKLTEVAQKLARKRAELLSGMAA